MAKIKEMNNYVSNKQLWFILILTLLKKLSMEDFRIRIEKIEFQH